MKKLIALILTLVLILILITACSQAENVSHNLSQQADNFNVPRRLIATSLYTGDNLFTMEGYFSITQDNIDGQLEIVVETGKNKYAKHFIKTGDMMSYVVEQLDSRAVNRYSYTLNYNPKMWQPFNLEYID